MPRSKVKIRPGWRRIKPGELKETGDQYLDPLGLPRWVRSEFPDGLKLTKRVIAINGPYIRRISSHD
jgi:hypothetical protein